MTTSPTATDLPVWARRVVTYGGSGYAALSILSSSYALGHLAWEAGYHDPRAVLFGVGFDVAAGVTGTAWAAGAVGSWWFHTGRRATLALFAASLVFNAVEVLQVRQVLPADGLLLVAVCVSLVFPALAIVFGHLVLVARHADDPPPPPATTKRGPRRKPHQPVSPAATAEVAAATEPNQVGGDLVGRARQLVDSGAGRPKLRRELGISDHQARQILQQIRAGDHQPASDGATNGAVLVP